MDLVTELRRGAWCNYWTVGPNPTGFAVDPSPVPAAAADEIERLRGSLAIADTALRNWWGWEYGGSNDVDCTDARLLIAWREDFVARSQAGACAAHSGEE